MLKVVTVNTCTCTDVFTVITTKKEYIIGASLSEPHTSVVYGTTCIDRPTD